MDRGIVAPPVEAQDPYIALSEAYRHRVNGGAPVTHAAEIDPRQERAHLARVKDSHRGIGAHRQLRRLVAEAVDQAFLEEIGELTELVALDLRWPVRAADLSPLAALDKLEVLHIEGAGRVADWTPLHELARLRVLTVEAPRAGLSLQDFGPLLTRLRVFGLEGSINKNYAIDTLEDLRGSPLEALFCTSLTLRDKSLAPLCDCPDLKLLSGGVLAPWTQYAALRSAKPGLVCQSFEARRWPQHWRDGPSDAERAADATACASAP